MLITILKDPANISNQELIDVPDGTLLTDWLIDYYGPDGFKVPTEIFSGAIAKNRLIDLSDFDRVNQPITENLYVIQRPLGGSLIVAALSLIAVSVAVSSLVPIPKLPQGERVDKKSPNNSLSGQSNIARPLERVPDIFGTVKSFPDLIAPTTAEFIDNVLFNTDYMCISRGFLDVTEIKSGDTLVSAIVGSSVQLFDPGISPTEVLKTTTSNEVKTLTLNPLNDIGIRTNSLFLMSYDSVADTGYIYSNVIADWNDYSIGSSATLEDVFFNNGATELNVDGAYTVNYVSNVIIDIDGYAVTYDSGADRGTVTGTGFSTLVAGSLINLSPADISGSNRFLDGLYVIFSASATELVVADAAIVNSRWTGVLAGGEPITGTGNRASQIALGFGSAETISNNWNDASLPENLLEVLNITNNRILTGRVFLPDEVKIRGPFVVPDNNNDQIWLDFSFPRGLVRDSNKNVQVDISVLIEEIDNLDVPTGPTLIIPYSFTDNELEALNFTRKITLTDGLDINKRQRISVQRTSNTDPNDDSLVDQIQWTRLASIDDITNTDTTGTTRIQIKTRATEQTASLQNREFNMLASRKVVTFSGGAVVGDIETGVGLITSSRMADIFLHYSLDSKLAARDISQIDVPAIFAIQDSLDPLFNGQLGEFNYTFDNQNTPALEELRQIANASRCVVFREGSIISIVRDEIQPISRALFNRRNKKPDSESKTIQFNKPLDVNGVQLEYVDSDKKFKTQTITLPDDLKSFDLTDDPNFNLPDTTNPLKIESTGVTNRQQAWNRAQYELNRIIHQRINVETGVTEEGILLPLNARIDHVDGTTLARVQSDGDVLAFTGLTVTTSERCIFDPTKTYSVILRDENGTPSNTIIVTENPNIEFGFVLSTAPPFPLFVRGFNDNQVATLYNFAPDGDELANQYLVQRKSPDSDGNVTLELINYTDKYYQADAQVAPKTSAYSSGYSEGYE